MNNNNNNTSSLEEIFRFSRTGKGYDTEKGLVLKNIFSLHCDGKIATFQEECDAYYEQKCSKEQAILILKRMLAYLENPELEK